MNFESQSENIIEISAVDHELCSYELASYLLERLIMIVNGISFKSIETDLNEISELINSLDLELSLDPDIILYNDIRDQLRNLIVGLRMVTFPNKKRSLINFELIKFTYINEFWKRIIEKLNDTQTDAYNFGIGLSNPTNSFEKEA